MAIAVFYLLVQLLSFSGKGYASRSLQQGVHVIRLQSLLPSATCSDTTSPQGVGDNSELKIVHRHGPCSNLFHHHGGQEKANTSTISNTEEILRQDQIRVDSIQFSLSAKSKTAQELTSKATELPASSGSTLGNGNYIVQMGFGTPKKLMSIVFDTGSDFTWIQCKPCSRSCYEQQEPIFDPHQSMSYSNITCNTTECSQLKSATGNSPICGVSSNCVYGIQYGDQSFSAGYFVNDTLTVTGKDVFKNFQFGCGQNNEGLFGKAAGLLGLGRDKLSFVSQTSKKYGGVFSYCLPSSSSSTGYLSFGAKRKVSRSVKFTPLLSQKPSFYYLDLVAISVGGQKLSIPASVFSSGGTIIDSGTVITRLPQTAYTPLQSKFKEFMSKYPSAEPAVSLLDTCFNLTGYDEISIPHISLHFQGGTALNVDAKGILVVLSIEQVCLAFAGNAGLSIIGNYQQMKTEVIYDLGKNRVGFGPGTCM